MTRKKVIAIKLQKGDDVLLKERFPDLQLQAKKVGITMTDKGTFYGKGLKGRFAIKPEYVEVHMDEKPWGVFDWMIKEKLETLIADALV